jgi:F0F1-type ATP synthase membrane subunit c/vacuolar-type H+-ATPase subunit K
MALRTDRPALQRAALGVAFAAFGAAVWIAGLFAANVRIMCRLF